MDSAFQWICNLRKDYSANSDVWNLRRDWEHIKEEMLTQLNDGSYQFGVIDRLEFPDGTLSLWSSQDMIALKLLSQALGLAMKDHIPQTCYHVKGHGGLKKAVSHTCEALPGYSYVLRTDIKSYYESVDFNALQGIISAYVQDPVLLRLVYKACRRTETWGGNFQEFDKKGIPRGSPLSPLLGAIALLPLDLAMGKIKGIFYARFQDDWLVFAKSKTALRKVVKRTHGIINALNFRLHPLKTFIGKITHGFNFLGYYIDPEKILPSRESVRRFQERSVALYEESQTDQTQRRRRRAAAKRDVSEYLANEAAPTDEDFKNILIHLLSLPAPSTDVPGKMRRYVQKWASWTKLGISTTTGLESCVQTHLPHLYSCWVSGGITQLCGDIV